MRSDYESTETFNYKSIKYLKLGSTLSIADREGERSLLKKIECMNEEDHKSNEYLHEIYPYDE